ncbi:MAG: PAS domain S-box protein [Cyanobacteria bacterium]|nr:PAS domain S-box protein [Cyanobacteriota bacterium]
MTSQQPSTQNQPNQAENLATDRFPVVGIGASAGGLEAFRQLLSHLPTDTGMAFVLIQHLDPNHRSLLREILARETAMPAIEVANNMAVEPNCVYTIPPNTKMTIDRGRLKLTPREKNRAMIKPVDTFLLSLAVDLGNKAIAVVLSGGDGDGARGLEAVKEAGGITFAQSEDSAKVSSMPNTAVATGGVDFILTPQQIAGELANISHHPYIASPTPAKAVEVLINDESAMQTILTLLRTATGVNFTQYKHGTLNRRILRRMVVYKLENINDYVTYLRGHSTEVQALFEDVLIHVTSFFRDPNAFKTLQTKVFPTIANRGPEVPIRIWVAGCSTGEEAYSIAMCLLEYLDNQPIRPQIQIFATDISDRVIETARAGFYHSSSVADVSVERLQRFFVAVDGGYRINKLIREMCVFARQNLCSEPPFSKLDLITCRNVLIYLGAALQKKILPTFHYGLKPTGFLMLGPSETTGDSSDLFTPLDKKQKIYARKLAPARIAVDLSANSHALALTKPTPSVEPPWNDFDLQKEADRIVLEQFAPVGVVIDNDLEIVHFRGQTSLYLEPAPGRASHNLLKMAKDGLKLELRAAVHQASKHNLAVSKKNLQITDNEGTRQLNFEVIPLQARGVEERYFLILFQAATLAALPPSTEAILTQNAEGITPQPANAASDLEIARLRQELATTKEYLRAIIEEQEVTNQDLRVANEEILSSNEEFQSSNEELETAKEEIQATNEELNTINDEFQRRNHELTQVSNDLQNLISSTNIPILMLGSDLCIRRFTPLAERILHLIPADVGRPLRDINHALNVPNLESQIREVINTLKTKEQEVQDQHGHWYDLRIRPYRTLDNKIDGAMVILVDIDALKNSMEQLEYSRNYAQAIVETIREPLIVLDRNLRVFTANQSFYQTFQATTAETEQRLIFDLGNGQWNIPKLRQLLVEILPTNSQLQDFEVEHDFEQIGHKTMLLNARTMTPLEGGDNILLAIEDITDRKISEAALLESEDRFRSTFEQAAVGIAHIALDGRWLLVNPKLCEICGYPLAELLGGAYQDITHPDDLAQDQESIRQLLADEIQSIESEKRYIHKLGHIIWVSVTGMLRRDDSGTPLYFVASIEDISHRKQAEFTLQAQAVKRAETTVLVDLRNQELNRFSHTVSHDLKAPLRGISNLAGWISEDLSETVDPDILANLELMRSRILRMDNLIDGSLEYARVGSTTASLETFSVEQLLVEIVDSLSIPNSFVVELPAELPSITTHRVLLSQVLANLIGNAYKHHDSPGERPRERPHGRIQITVQPDAEMWRFSVTDDGCGIAPENQERVFDIFKTLSSNDKNNTGIGLSIVKKLVETQGGKVTLESQLGMGTTFSFTWMAGLER